MIFRSTALLALALATPSVAFMGSQQPAAASRTMALQAEGGIMGGGLSAADIRSEVGWFLVCFSWFVKWKIEQYAQ